MLRLSVAERKLRKVDEMLHVPVFRVEYDAVPDDVLIAALREWRRARDCREAVQYCLYQLLAPQGRGMLAPVLDSLMTFLEAALARKVIASDGKKPSVDEQLLLDLLDGSRSRRLCLVCPEGVARPLDCAICSTQIMMASATKAQANSGLP